MYINKTKIRSYIYIYISHRLFVFSHGWAFELPGTEEGELGRNGELLLRILGGIIKMFYNYMAVMIANFAY